MLVVGGICYLVDMLALFLVPDFGKQIEALIVIPSTVAEVWLLGYLLVIGVRTSRSTDPAPAQA